MLVGRDWSSEHDRVRGSRLAEDEHRHAYCARCCFCSFISRDRIEFRDLYLFISIFKGFLSASSCPHQQYQLPFVCSSVFGVFVSSFLHSVRNGWEVNPVFLFPSFPSHQSIRLPELQSRLKPKKSPDKKKFIRLETKMENNEDSKSKTANWTSSLRESFQSQAVTSFKANGASFIFGHVMFWSTIRASAQASFGHAPLLDNDFGASVSDVTSRLETKS